MTGTSPPETGRIGRRRSPFIAVGEWVALADVSSRAKELYTLLLAHVNQSRKDGIAWPSRATLAELMRYSRANKVDGLLAELEELGAIEVERGRVRQDGSPAPNLYLVHEVPPPGYTGYESLTGWYTARRQHTKPPAASPGVGPKRGPGVGPDSDLGVSLDPDLGVGPKRGPEPPEVEPHEVEPPPLPPREDPASDPATPAPGAEENHPGTPDTTGDAQARQLLRTAPWPTGYQPTARQRTELITLTRRALDRGHTEATIRDVLAPKLDGANNPGAVVAARLQPLADTDPTREQQTAATKATKRAMATTTHDYVEGPSVGYCLICDLWEGNRVHPATTSPKPATRCAHDRVQVLCDQCGTRPAEHTPAQQPVMATAGQTS